MSKEVLVLGLGNILLHDEGIGVYVIEAFQKTYETPDGVEICDGGTSGVDMIDIVAGRPHMIVCDAVRTGADPATLVKLKDDEVKAFFRTRISPHQLGLSDLLATLSLTDEQPERLTVVGVVPVVMTTGMGISPELEPVLLDAVEMLADELRSLGFELKRRPQAAE